MAKPRNNVPAHVAAKLELPELPGRYYLRLCRPNSYGSAKVEIRYRVGFLSFQEHVKYFGDDRIVSVVDPLSKNKRVETRTYSWKEQYEWAAGKLYDEWDEERRSRDEITQLWDKA